MSRSASASVRPASTFRPMRNLFRLRAMASGFLTVITAVSCRPGNCSAAIPAPEKLLPDDTMLMLTMPDFTRVIQIYKTSPQTRFWNDPAVKPFKDKFMSRLTEELIEPLERDLGIRLDDYAGLPQGQLTLAISRDGWNGNDNRAPALLLLLDTREKSGQLKTNLAALRRKWVDAGKTLRTEKIRNVEFTILPLSDRDIPGSLKKFFDVADEESEATNQAPKSEFVFGQYESLLVAGTSTRAVEKVVAHLTGGSMPALGDLAAFEANRLTMFRDSPFYGWADVKTFVDLRFLQAPSSDEPNPLGLPGLNRIANALGLGGLRSVAFNLAHSDEGIGMQFFVGVPESGRQGLFRLFPASGKDSGPPPFVPATAVRFQRARLDGQKAFATLEKVANELYPGYLGMALEAANTAAKEQDPDFDVRKNLIGNLGDDLIIYGPAPKGNTLLELSSAPTLYLIGSPRADVLASAVKSVLGLTASRSGPLKEREFLGRKIYSLGTSEGPGRAARGSMNFAASGGYLAISADVSLLEEYLRSSESQQKKLRERTGLSEAITRVGGASTGWFGYEDQSETSRASFEAMRKRGEDGDQKMLAEGIPAFTPENPFREWMDFSLLPPFDKIAKYFYFTVFTGSATAEGFNFKVFYPVPPQLR
jgi:hypothetical protein